MKTFKAVEVGDFVTVVNTVTTMIRKNGEESRSEITSFLQGDVVKKTQKYIHVKPVGRHNRIKLSKADFETALTNLYYY